ncbi:MAG: hypothetical protein ACE5ER_09220 [Nitrospinaceae bacterium]
MALLGTTPHKADAPFNDPDWEIWGVGRWSKEVTRWDRWFEIHDLSTLHIEYDTHLKYLADSGKPIYLHEPTPKVPNGIVLPREEIKRRACGSEFLSSTMAWMQAFALLIGQAQTIGLWGVDMASTEEYQEQRAGCKHWIHVALIMGREVIVSRHSDLLKEIRAYTDKPSPFEQKIHDRERNLGHLLDEKIKHAKRLELEIAHLGGIKTELEYFRDSWTGERTRLMPVTRDDETS